MKLTEEGSKILSALESGESVGVSARAGSGKTTLAVEACQDGTPTQYIVYTRANRDSVYSRLSGTPTTVSTINGFTKSQLDEILGIRTIPFADAHVNSLKRAGVQKVYAEVQTAWELLRLRFPLANDQMSLSDGLDDLLDEGLIKPYIFKSLYANLEKIYECTLETVKKGSTDFVDQIWAPLHLHDGRMEVNVDRIIVDELQDASPATIEFLRRLNHVQMLGIGDPYQLCFGFAGAIHGNMQDFMESQSAKKYLLSKCFRCSDAVIEFAQQIVPDIKGTGTRKGSVEQKIFLEIEDMRSLDMLVCGRYRPLMNVYFRCLAEGIPVNFKSRECLAKVAKEISKDLTDDFATACHVSAERLFSQAEKLPLTLAYYNKRSSLQDQAACILETIGFINSLEELITLSHQQGTKGGVILSTIHTAKGLEAERVCFLGSESTNGWRLPTESQYSDPHNLAYIAITRAIDRCLVVEHADVSDLPF
jgi:superfamily I DNA/RNA helicase